MVVDDNASNLKLLERVLVEQGLSVRTFLRGAAVLAAAEQEPLPSAQPAYCQVFHGWRLWPKSSGINRAPRKIWRP
jgi:CheY-like chemotaxis protein